MARAFPSTSVRVMQRATPRLLPSALLHSRPLPERQSMVMKASCETRSCSHGRQVHWIDRPARAARLHSRLPDASRTSIGSPTQRAECK